jgi:hypothetical protein
MNEQQNSEVTTFLPVLQKGIWLFGISAWIFGLTDRSIALFADGYLSAIDIVQLFTASFFFISWLFLNPYAIARTPKNTQAKNSDSKVKIVP